MGATAWCNLEGGAGLQLLPEGIHELLSACVGWFVANASLCVESICVLLDVTSCRWWCLPVTTDSEPRDLPGPLSGLAVGLGASILRLGEMSFSAVSCRARKETEGAREGRPSTHLKVIELVECSWMFMLVVRRWRQTGMSQTAMNQFTIHCMIRFIRQTIMHSSMMRTATTHWPWRCRHSDTHPLEARSNYPLKADTPGCSFPSPCRQTPLWTEWHTGVEALPCPILRLLAV